MAPLVDDKVATTTTEKVDVVADDSQDVTFVWDTLLGTKLRLNKDHVNTSDHLDNNDIEFICLYFSAHWCPPCQTFTPQLIDFYNKINITKTDDKISKRSSKTKATKNKKLIEIIYVPSDRNVTEFETYYKTMPWYSIDVINNTEKKLLASMFTINSIPTMIVLNGKNGLFITNNGRNDIIETIKNKNYEAVLEKWRSITPVPIEESSLMSSASTDSILTMLKDIGMKFITNPMYIFGMLYIAKWFYRHYIKPDSTSPTMIDGNVVVDDNEVVPDDEF